MDTGDIGQEQGLGAYSGFVIEVISLVYCICI